MANPESKKLTVEIVARVDKLEKSMAKAKGSVDKNARAMESRAAQLSSRLNATVGTAGKALAGLGGAFLGGFAVGGLSEIVASIGDVAKSVAEVGDQAKIAGVNLKSFQELKYVAEQNRIGVDALTDGLKEMNLRADEFITTGQGSAAQAFQRLGYSAETLKEKLKDPSALFTEIIGKLGQLDRAAQIRVADEVFGGTGGERFVQLISQGEAGLRDTIQAANDLGVVMDDEVIKKAEELDRQFRAVSDTVGTALKQAIVNAASALSGFIDTFNTFQEQQSRTLRSEQSGIDQQRVELENKILGLKEKQASITGVLAEAEKRQIGGTINQVQAQLDALTKRSSTITDILGGRNKPAPTEITVRPHKPSSTGSGSGGGGSSAASSARSEADAVRELIASLQEELRLVGATDAEREKSANLRRAGAAATEEQRSKIAALTDQIYAEKQAQEQLKEAQEAARQAGSFAIDTIGEALEGVANGSMKASEAVKQLAVQLAIAAAKGALLGEGPLAGVFGGSGGGGAILGGLFTIGIGGDQ